MLYLRMFRAEVPTDLVKRMAELKTEVGKTLRPLLRPTIDASARILGVTAESLVGTSSLRSNPYRGAEVALDGEVFTDGETLVVMALRSGRSRRSGWVADMTDIFVHEQVKSAPPRLEVSVIGPSRDFESLPVVLDAAERAIGRRPEAYGHGSGRFDELKAEGRTPPAAPSSDELQASQALQDRLSRTLAIAIKSSGGLLVGDLPKQLRSESRDRVDALAARLKEARLVDSEFVVVCGKTQAQVTRTANRDLLTDSGLRGLKCACGRALAEERIEEALAITDLGRGLLDKARWMTVLLLHELEAVGVSSEDVLVEQNVGGDEIDCVANINGDVALFELKDKEFNLGNAYSFGAKMGIISPKYPVIVSTEQVGNDAKEHFKRARLSGTHRERNILGVSEGPQEVIYIEGIQNLRNGIERLVTEIYRNDTIRILDRVLPLAALDGATILGALEREDSRPEAVVEDVADLGEEVALTAPELPT